jgi:hypothetical protein
MSCDSDYQAAEGLFIKLCLWAMIVGIIVTYGILVLAVSLIPAILKTVKIGWSRSIVTNFVTIVLPFFMPIPILLLYFELVGVQNARNDLATFLLVVPALATYLILARKIWRTTNRPFTKIWKWYAAKMLPHWTWGFRGLKNMPFNELSASF